MITIHIISEEESVISKMAEWLLRENLVHESVDLDFQDMWKLRDGNLVKTAAYKLSARTKALLFSTIEAGLSANFPQQRLCLYSTPVINMDKQNQQALIMSTLRV